MVRALEHSVVRYIASMERRTCYARRARRTSAQRGPLSGKSDTASMDRRASYAEVVRAHSVVRYIASMDRRASYAENPHTRRTSTQRGPLHRIDGATSELRKNPTHAAWSVTSHRWSDGRATRKTRHTRRRASYARVTRKTRRARVSCGACSAMERRARTRLPSAQRSVVE